jgi:Fe(3+) dicitrate transport protein
MAFARFRPHPIALAVLSVLATSPAIAAVEESATPEQSLLPSIKVVGSKDKSLNKVAGTATVIGQSIIDTTHPMSVNEVLRKVTGVHARDEEGLGLRPNIGIRGLNPTRSTKTTLLEDGLPLAYAPYGDNASYYHPMVERYQRIEVLKGSESLRFGPQTIGGVINYITPAPSKDLKGYVQASVGNRDFSNIKINASVEGALLDFSRKESDGARDNMHHELNDLNLKYVFNLTDTQRVVLRSNYYTEDSQITYTGLTQAEFEKFGRDYNPFKNDQFEIERIGASIGHEWQFAPDAQLLTNVYFSRFDRDWWRQASTTTDPQCGGQFTADRVAGVRVDPDLCNSAQGRLRSYTTWGVEPRLTVNTELGELQAGLRYHNEEQDRQQVNATSATGRSGTLSEDNLRDTEAYSAFVSHRFDLPNNIAITPIVRYENIEVSRNNRLANQSGSTDLDQVITGLGVTWNPDSTTTFFASVHEGFAPPRVEDLIGGAGTVVEVNAEESTNLEVGIRSTPIKGIALQAAYFRNDFDNLIAVGSIAGGSTALSEGKALFEGLEFSANGQYASGLFSRLAYTWLPNAEQETAFKNVANGAAVGVAGNRQPYAPEHTLTAAVGYEYDALRGEVEAQYVGEQYSDFANTEAPTADGQKGRIASYTIYNASLNYAVTPKASAFLTGKNLTDKTYIVDRTRGIQVGMPRLVQVGMKFKF